MASAQGGRDALNRPGFEYLFPIDWSEPFGLTMVEAMVTRELLAGAWAAGACPGAAPLTIDLDSTICETYGLLRPSLAVRALAGGVAGPPPLPVASRLRDRS